MRIANFPISFVAIFFVAIPQVLQSQATALPLPKRQIMQSIDSKFETYKTMAAQIWELSEVGYQEFKSTEILQKQLRDAGFRVENGVASMPTAFIATWGSGKPVIGILAEFDALPGLSQTTAPEKTPDLKREAGHACGHHLFGVASTAAGIAAKEFLEKERGTGTIRVYGTPAEEGGSGKVYMVREGLFNDVDVVLHWHPSDRNNANAGRSLANMSAKFRFHGISAHAAGAPDKGRSALDGVEAMNHMVNLMREHIPQETRIHYVITSGGKAPNVIPDFAEVYYYVRHPERSEVKRIFDWIKNCADGAALGTATKVDFEIIGGVYDLLPVESLAKIMQQNLEIVGGVDYTADELAFAKKIQATLLGEKNPEISTAKLIDPYVSNFKRSGGGGSTDVGDVSWVVPTVGLRTATWVPGTPAHSWQAVACGGTDIGFKGMMVAAKTLANAAFDLFHDRSAIDAAREEWVKARGGADFKYESLLGNRPPALNYRE